jgi:hypothetical protein
MNTTANISSGSVSNGQLLSWGGGGELGIVAAESFNLQGIALDLLGTRRKDAAPCEVRVMWGVGP